jgi:octaheme c-type cytochrome (tetrathionate reductase family)
MLSFGVIAIIMLFFSSILAQEIEIEIKSTFMNHSSAKALMGPFDTANQVTEACLSCHKDAGDELIKSIHWTWQGSSPYMAGHETDVTQGKRTTINNFCISPNTNLPRCTQCHAGYGQIDSDYDFTDQSNIDCLVCHEQTGKYKKNPKAAGKPFEDTDLVAAAQSVAMPSRANCGTCHFFSAAGDNAKKGDLSSAMIEPDEQVDVHMGRLDFTCQSCHITTDHKMLGSSLHIGVTMERMSCTDCHLENVHNEENLDRHTAAVACQTCHIPAFSRAKATKTFWDWSKAGRLDADGKELIKKDLDGNIVYDSKKGELTWTKNIRPEYAWWNGNFNRMLVGDTYKDIPVNLASPIGSIEDMDSKIYPFKVMRGIQPADPVNKMMLIPHLFPSSAGENAYWKNWDWDPAFTEGMAALGLAYSGSFEWVETYMYMVLNHEIPPKSEALSCMDCHGVGIDFKALGYQDDPMMTGGRAGF